MHSYLHNPYTHGPEGFVLHERIPASEQAGDLTASTSATGRSAAAPSGATVSKVLLRQGITVEAALDELFPPMDDGEEDGVPMRRVASRQPGDKMAVIHLQESLEEACAREGARPHGVCPIREKIYADALDELIRQSAVACPERGQLLAELRDEVNETNTAYDLLFDASAQFGVRKEIERDLKRTMESSLDSLTVEVAALDHRVHEIKAKYEGLERMLQERRSAEEKKHADEVQFLKKGNQQLQTEIKRWGT